MLLRYSISVTIGETRYTHAGLILLYKTLFLPLLSYGSIVWDDTHSSHPQLLEVVQNDALRALLRLNRFASVADLYQQLELLTLK